jgi:hypothetical protein
MLLQVSRALLFFCRTGCFLELKLHVLLVSFLYSGLQSNHMFTTLEQYETCLFYVIQENLRIWFCLYLLF